MPQTVQTEQELPLQDYANQTTVTATAIAVLDASFAGVMVKSLTTSTPPGSPSSGDRYIVGASATGAWSGWDDYFALYHNAAWIGVPPKEGWTVRLEGTTERWRYDGSAWVEASSEIGTVTTGITASVTQTQGQGALSSTVNYIETCANANDTVTLPSATKGAVIYVANDGAQTLQIFPASGDAIDTGATDASRTLAASGRCQFIAVSAALWLSLETT